MGNLNTREAGNYVSVPAKIEYTGVCVCVCVCVCFLYLTLKLLCSQVLDLSNNKLSEIPSDLSDCSKL